MSSKLEELEELFGTEFVPARCEKCQKKIVFVRTPEGKSVTLDPAPPCYRVGRSDSGPMAFPRRDVWVSHFCTCPHSEYFSGNSAKPQQQERPRGAKPAVIIVEDNERGGAYTHRETLKSNRFRFNEHEPKRWGKTVSDAEIDKTIAWISEVTAGACRGELQK